MQVSIFIDDIILHQNSLKYTFKVWIQRNFASFFNLVVTLRGLLHSFMSNNVLAIRCDVLQATIRALKQSLSSNLSARLPEPSAVRQVILSYLSGLPSPPLITKIWWHQYQYLHMLLVSLSVPSIHPVYNSVRPV